uniref:hypothetical protein n=1 Tax=Paracoccus sp. TRP TaxID=412597 RepID=UPI000225FC18|nr:hypothetical protein [Paracoccus sp. TRP]
MSRAQGYELIGIAWLFLAAYDRPLDMGSLAYFCAAFWAFRRAADAAFRSPTTEE